MEKAKANGVLIRNGYLVGEWNFAGRRETKIDIRSCGKAINSLVLGLAIDERLVPSLDARVKPLYPAFEVGPYTDEITFRHLVTMTSGIENRTGT